MARSIHAAEPGGPPVSRAAHVARVFHLLIFGSPQVLILVPLSAWLLCNYVVGLCAHELPVDGWYASVRCAALLGGLSLVFLLSIGVMVLLIVEGWRDR